MWQTAKRVFFFVLWLERVSAWGGDGGRGFQSVRVSMNACRTSAMCHTNKADLYRARDTRTHMPQRPRGGDGDGEEEVLQEGSGTWETMPSTPRVSRVPWNGMRERQAG